MSATSSAAGSDFGADDEVTSAAVGLILDSLDDIHCLLEAKVGFSIYKIANNVFLLHFSLLNVDGLFWGLSIIQ